MPQKKPMSDAELAAFEASQDFDALLVQSAREMGAGKTRKVYTPVVAARENAGLSQAGFAELLGVSVRTLQQWEQGRREPTGAAKTLIAIADAQKDSGFTILGGDLNSEPASKVVDALRNSGWRDVFPDCGKGERFTFPADLPVKRIDYLLLSGTASCVTASVLDTRASDHRPVLFEISK